LQERERSLKDGVIKIDGFKRMIYPSERYKDIPTMVVVFNETKIEMHHEVLKPILPEEGRNWFRRVRAHRYSFVVK
jgi:hypothetical protein